MTKQNYWSLLKGIMIPELIYDFEMLDRAYNFLLFFVLNRNYCKHR